MTHPLYRLLLRLHPRAFRERFAPEMLWIFEESNQPAPLLLDAALSLLRQYARPQPSPQPTLAGFCLLDQEPGITARRLLEASAVATLFLAATLLLLGHPPRTLSLPSCPPGAPRPAARPIHAPSRIQPLAVAAASPTPPSGPAQVDNAVAGAVHFLRTHTTSAPGFCAN